jgi:hypothetical protein
MAAGYASSWLEGLVLGAAKIEPLGQTQRQQALLHLADAIPSALKRDARRMRGERPFVFTNPMRRRHHLRSLRTSLGAPAWVALPRYGANDAAGSAPGAPDWPFPRWHSPCQCV